MDAQQTKRKACMDPGSQPDPSHFAHVIQAQLIRNILTDRRTHRDRARTYVASRICSCTNVITSRTSFAFPPPAVRNQPFDCCDSAKEQHMLTYYRDMQWHSSTRQKQIPPPQTS